MNSVTEYFDKIFCINLDSRTDRWRDCLVEFKKLGIEDYVTRIPGIIFNFYEDKKRDAAIGCHLTHASIMNVAKSLKLNNVLIFEDDVQFLSNITEVLPKAIEDLKTLDWDMFYLGANLERPCYAVTENLAKLTFAFSTHAYAVRSTMFDKLYDINVNINIPHNDVYISDNIIPNHNCYIATPIVAIQRQSYSDIEKRVVDYSWMIDRFNQNWKK